MREKTQTYAKILILANKALNGGQLAISNPQFLGNTTVGVQLPWDRQLARQGVKLTLFTPQHRTKTMIDYYKPNEQYCARITIAMKLLEEQQNHREIVSCSFGERPSINITPTGDSQTPGMSTMDQASWPATARRLRASRPARLHSLHKRRQSPFPAIIQLDLTQNC